MPELPEKKKKKPPVTAAEEISDDIGEALALQVFHDSEGGRILIDALVADVLSALDIACGGVGTMTHIELVSLIVRIKERVDLLRVLTSAKANKEVYEDLLAVELKRQKENPPAPPTEEPQEGGL